MDIDLIQKEDLDQLQRIHNAYFKNEFEFPDFINEFLDVFVVKDNDLIVCAGGVKVIAEAVVLTNKEFSPKKRRDALLRIAQAMAFITKKHGHNQLHAFIDDPPWRAMLMKNGFRFTKGQALVVDLKD